MEEIDANYQELITVSKEVLIRNRVTQKQNEELMGQNKELQIKIQLMEAENSRLQNISQALDGLTILVEVARKM